MTTNRGDGSRREPGGSSASTHGFLFADLRGYTAYLERRGARDAAQLLARYRALVRAAVAGHDGAEIRTEGDSFYVVFPSASAAVACALDIVDAAGSSGADLDPISVGVGVHAGESIETAEGPVGTAVNIAARLCALAGAGSVLVSDTVRSLTRSVGPAAYTFVGRRRLKGVDEPIAVYRAMRAAPGETVPARRGVPRRRLVAGAVVVGALAAVAGLWRPWDGGIGAELPPSAEPIPSVSISASAAATESPAVSATPPPGLFTTTAFSLPFTIDLGPRWERVGEEADVAAYFHPQQPVGWIDVVLVAAVLDPPCVDSAPIFIGERPVDIIEWLATRPWLEATTPVPYNVGSYRGRAVDITVGDDGVAECPVRTDQVAFFRLGGLDPEMEFGGTWGTDIGERKRIIALDVEGETVMLAIGSPYPDVEQFWALSETYLQSLRFDDR